jgi:chemotaxis protein MotB
MTSALRRCLHALPLAAPVLLSGCVTQSAYDDLLARYQQATADIARLQSAIKYTVNSDQLFASGSWQMSRDGQDIIAKMASQLAPTQRNALVVKGYTDNAPIGPALRAKGVTTNEDLSQKRAESVMQFLVSHGMNPALVQAHGYGEANPVASNETAAGRAQNRRVELTLAGS